MIGGGTRIGVVVSSLVGPRWGLPGGCMPGRESVVESHPDAVIFRSPPNWTAVAFFGALGSLHLVMATTSLLAGRGGAHMSVVFGVIFATVGAGFFVARRDVVFRPERRRIFGRTGGRGWGL